MAIYHITLFLLRRSDLSTLYFGMFCLLIGAHLTAGSGSSIISLMLDLDFRGHILLYNFSWMIGIPVFGLFTHSLFPGEFLPLVNRTLLAICGCFLIFLGSTEVRTFIFSTQIYQVIAFVGILYVLYVIGLATKRQRDGSKTFLIAICILFSGSINDMLMIRGLMNSIPMAAASLFLFIFGQSYLLSVRFSRAYTRAETSEGRVRKLAEDLKEQNVQITELNETLESRVDEQTRDIRSIMEHTPIAIFAIEGPESTVHRDYSLRLEQVIEDKNLAGREILPLLFASSSLSTDEFDQLKQALASMIGEQEMSFELNEQRLPRSFTKTAKNGTMKQFEAVWNPIVNDAGTIDKVLVALTDVTEVRHLEVEARERAAELQTIGEIISIKDEVFQRFQRSCKKFNDQNRQLLEHADPGLRDSDLVKVVFMNMHTMKGAARTLRLKKLADLFHDLESYYSLLAKQDHVGWDLQRMKRDIEVIDQSLLEYEKIAVEKLGRRMEDGASILLPISSVNAGFHELHAFAHEQKLSSGLHELYASIQDALFMPLSTLMRDIFKDMHSLAKDLEKPLPTVHFDVPFIMIRLQSEELLRNIFVHLLRNSLDHGIESPAERSNKGKNKVGEIQLLGRIDPHSVVLWLEDDGRGLNLTRLLNLGRERGLIAADAIPSADECADLIFNDGISTANAVTIISGRGMGMAAVRRYLEESKGSIRIELKQKTPYLDQAAPFRLRIELPLALFSTKLEAAIELERSAS